MTAARAPANPIVLTGLRGMGKTSLLRHIAREAEAAGAVAIVAEADPDLRFGEVMKRELRDALRASRPLPARLSSAIGRIIEQLPKLSYELPHDAGSIDVAGAGSSDDVDDVRDSIEGSILTLNEQLARHDKFLMIGLDEIQESPKLDLLRVVRAVHKTAGSQRPILFFGAGLPNAPSLLKSVRTYTERWAYFRLDLLSRDAAFEAAAKPAAALGVTWTSVALEELFRRSLGYPYFLQAFASATWAHHHGPTIDIADIESVVAGVQKMLDESIYDRQFAQLSAREIAFVLALDRLGRGAHRLDAVAVMLGLTTSSDLGSTRTRLIAKDLIFAPSRGLAEFRMPLTNEYIARHRPALDARASRAS